MLLHDAVWVLPGDAKTREAFEWLAEDIGEYGGTAFVWEAESLGEPQDQEVVRRFRAEADARYTELAQSARRILRAATRARRRGAALAGRVGLRQLAGLARAVRLERRRDYFRAAGRVEAEAAVTAAIAALDAPRLAGLPAGEDHALDHSATSAH